MREGGEEVQALPDTSAACLELPLNRAEFTPSLCPQSTCFNLHGLTRLDSA